MSYFKIALCFMAVSLFGGCSSVDLGVKNESVAYVMPGTSTAVIGVSIDKTGLPQVRYKEIILYPGQKVLFAGPDELSIFFKDKKTPNRRIENPSVRGAVIIQIPKDILEQREFSEEFRRNHEVKFSYGIRVGNKELDPVIIIRRGN
jgi:hypothetical protein